MSSVLVREMNFIEVGSLVVDQVPLSQFAFVCLRFNESKHSFFFHSVHSETSINDTQVFTKLCQSCVGRLELSISCTLRVEIPLLLYFVYIKRVYHK